jgi:glycosyltransferase involved in cell wall biosynthesis
MPESTIASAIPRFSFVVPVFNEEAVLPAFFAAMEELLGRLGASAEVILVDDGSRDESAAIIRKRAASDPRYRFIGLSRNFGQQIAVTAGLDHARGSAVAILDADLQDPPELVLEMIAKWRAGYDIVYARRCARKGESRFKRATAKWFYRLVNTMAPVPIPDDVGEFRLVDRAVVDVMCAMREQDRFLRGMFAWVGYKQIGITFDRPSRAAGETKYSLSKMAGLALSGVLSLSDVPLKLVVAGGSLVSLCALLYGVAVIAMRFIRSDLVPGWSSIIVITSFFAGINMLMTGIVGLYVGRIHNQVRMRPLYLVREAVRIPELEVSDSRRDDFVGVFPLRKIVAGTD